MGCVLAGQQKTVIRHAESGTEIDLLKATSKELKTFLHGRLVVPMLQQLECRAHLQGIQQLDIRTTKQQLSGMKKGDPLRGPLISVLTDSLPTQRRRYRASLIATDHCDLCGAEGADQIHIIWECSALESLRRDWPLRDHASLPRCAQTALLCTMEMDGEKKQQWPRLQLGVAILVREWQKERRDSTGPHDELQQHLPRPRRSEGIINEGDTYCLLRQRQRSEWRCLHWRLPRTSVERKSWAFEYFTFAQVWRYWSGCCEAPEERQVSWIEVWLDFFTTNGCQPLCDSWQSESSIRRQVWRFKEASTRLLLRCDDETHLADESATIQLHPGLPPQNSTGMSFALWHPTRVALAIECLITEHGSMTMNRGSTLSWHRLREHLPQEWHIGTIPKTRPDSGWFGRMNAKTKPHVAIAELEEDEKLFSATSCDPMDFPFEILCEMKPLAFAGKYEDKAKRRILCLRQRWSSFAKMMAAPEGHRAPPLWQSNHTRCARCHVSIDMGRITPMSAQKCRGQRPLDNEMLKKWQEELAEYQGWLHQPLTVPCVVADSLLADIRAIRDFDKGQVCDWLRLPREHAKGLILGRLKALLLKWQQVSLAWTLPAKHCPLFDAVDAPPHACLRCTVSMPPTAKLKGFLMGDCNAQFDMVAGDTSVMLHACDEVIRVLQSAMETVRIP